MGALHFHTSTHETYVPVEPKIRWVGYWYITSHHFVRGYWGWLPGGNVPVFQMTYAKIENKGPAKVYFATWMTFHYFEKP